MSKVIVFKKEGKIVTDSLTVANEFGKDHGKVLRSVRQAITDLPTTFTEANFGLSDYQDETGRSLPKYDLTRDAWMYVVMGFTGKKAAAVKLVFISEFNRMEAELVGRGNQKAPLTQKEMLQMALAEIERLEGEVKLRDDAPVRHALINSLQGIDIYNEYPGISKHVDVYMKANPNPKMKGPGAYTTAWLKQVHGLKTPLKITRFDNKGPVLFDRADIEALITKLGELQ
jgi:Rha family phage regulatory protein